MNQFAPPETTETTRTLESRSGYLDMLPVALTNALLVIVTFNVYLFWAKCNVRGYLWRTTLLDGKPLAYSGSGTELARGFAVTAALFLGLFGYPGLILINALNVDPELLALPDTGLLVSLILAAVVPAVISVVAFVLVVAPEIETTVTSTAISAVVLWLAINLFMTLSRYLTYRYLLRHTAWQGGAGDVPGSPWKYAFSMLLPELSTGFTAGWSAPWRFMRRFERLLDGATFAGRKLRFAGSSRVLYRPFSIAWVVIVGLVAAVNGASSLLDPAGTFFALQLAALLLVLFVGWVAAMAYYNARLYAHVAESITLDGVSLRFHAKATDLAALYFTNLVMNVLSGGLSYYYSRMRIARFIARHLEIRGDLTGAAEPSEPKRDILGEGAEILLAGSYF